MIFEFATAGSVVFGPGSADRVASEASKWGRRWLLVTGSARRGCDRIVDQLAEADCVVHRVGQVGEPTTGDVVSAVAEAVASEADGVLAVGGGSVIDLAKAIAALVPNPGPLYDYLEVVGAGRRLERNPLPVIAVPTTAGTGSEVTKNAVLTVDGEQQKVSLRDDRLLPVVAIVDPTLTLTMPAEVTASTGLDALTQVIEPYLSRFANPITDAIAASGIVHGMESLQRAYIDGSDLEARTGMSLTSLFGGISLANAKLGAVHGLAGPLGARFSAPHGAVCGRLLPIAFEVTARALAERCADESMRARPFHAAAMITGRSGATPDQGADFLGALVEDLAIPRLVAWGVSSDDVMGLVTAAKATSSMEGSPVQLTIEEIAEIVERAL